MAFRLFNSKEIKLLAHIHIAGTGLIIFCVILLLTVILFCRISGF